MHRNHVILAIVIVSGALFGLYITLEFVLDIWNPTPPDNQDTTPPKFSLHKDLVINVPSESGAIIRYDLPAVVDDVGVIGKAYCDPPSGEKFPLGMTIVTCFAVDAAENEGTTSFKITLNQLSEPNEN